MTISIQARLAQTRSKWVSFIGPQSLHRSARTKSWIQPTIRVLSIPGADPHWHRHSRKSPRALALQLSSIISNPKVLRVLGDPDAGDGQGNCNGTRTLAAQALVDWLATDPTGSGDPDFLIMGDLNSYAQEDPIDAIKAGSDDMAGTGDDFTNLIFDYHGAYAYSYTFDGQAGYLDHALANASLADQITGAADWHINSDEPSILDYDTSFKPPAQEALYEVNPYRTSDHDSVVVGLNLTDAIAPDTTIDSSPSNPTNSSSASFTFSGTDTGGSGVASFECDLDGGGFTACTSPQNYSSLADGSHTFQVRAIDGAGNVDPTPASFTWTIDTVAPTISVAAGMCTIRVPARAAQ